MMPVPPVAIHRLSRIEQDRILSNKNSYHQIATIAESKVDKIRLTNDQIKEFNNLALQLNNGSIKMEEAILQLRGGDGLTDVVAVIAFVILFNFYDSLFVVKAFQTNPLQYQNTLGWLNGKYNSKNVGPSPSRPSTSLKMEKPVAMPQQDYSSLTKSERRKLADPLGRDGSVEVDGYPRLDLRYHQVDFKTPKHGPDHGLPEDSEGKTPKTEANAIALRDSLIDMPNKPGVICYKEGMYQGGTPRSCKSVNVLNPDKNLIAVYQKYPDGTNLFLTTCKLTQMERNHLEATNGNFVTERVLKEQSSVSLNIQDNTNNNNELQ